jgi:succinate dehydrogenase/fumarate reductase cytochrome b subunit
MAVTAQRAKNSKTVQALGRAGMVCIGVVHLIVAYLALQVAFGDSSQQADQKGAIAEIGSTPFGKVILWVLAIGLFAYGIWQLTQAAIGFQWIQKKAKRTRRRISAVAKAIVGISLGITAARLASGGSSGGSGDQQQQEMTAKLLSLPFGQVLVAIVAAIVIGVGIAHVVKGVRKKFLDDLDLGDLPNGTQQWVRRLGMFGYAAKGTVLAIVGVLLGIAAFQSNAKEAGGLDSALRTLAAQPFGTIALIVVAIGLAAFGVYCFAAARANKS